MNEVKAIFANRASYILYNLFAQSKGKRVILPANVCPVVPATLVKAGLIVEFVDIDDTSWAMNGSQALARLKKAPEQYAGLIYVRTYGDMSKEVDSLFTELKSIKSDLLLVDDRCLAAPVFDPDMNSADLLLYSTGYSKIAELSWGGYAYSRPGLNYSPVQLPYQESYHEQLTGSFQKAIESGAKVDFIDTDWLDSGTPEISFEAYQEVVVEKREAALAHKSEINQVYRTILPSEMCLPDAFQSWRFHVLTPHKHKILKAIFDHGLFASSHYATVSHLFAAYRAPVSERLSNQVINLFNDYRFEVEQAEKVARIVKKHS